jgi:hypothetical protein
MYKKTFSHLWRVPILVLLTAAPLAGVIAAPDMTTFGKPVSDQVLAHHRGGHAINLNVQDLNANLFNNQADNNITGTNQITGHAFDGSSGVPTVIQNSGNNVIIQNATILNVKVQ